MNWLTFAIATYLLLLLQVGLRGLFDFNITAIEGAEPNLLLILMVFIAMVAPLHTSLWAALILGLLADLEQRQALVVAGDEPMHAVLVGPWALAFIAAAYVVLQMRGVVYRNSPLAFALTVFIAGMGLYLVHIAVLSIRGLPFLPGEAVAGWSATQELVGAFLNLVYSALIALLLHLPLRSSERLWRFRIPTGPARRAV